ncbi:MAG TPA: SgcJ/EcaC family oxidoreductase, partial [Myxococcaceae bacterium]|nr:SgcJ/EcaC family oxidoreductase [Myxococcaceae bacterium]
MSSMRRCFAGCAVLWTLGCSKVDLERERAAILATDGPWQQAIAARDVDRVVSFWADDAVVMPAGQPSLAGKSAIRGFVTETFKIPGFGLRWETSSVQVASSGDLAYALAKTTTTFTGPDGKPVDLPGKAAT